MVEQMPKLLLLENNLQYLPLTFPLTQSPNTYLEEIHSHKGLITLHLMKHSLSKRVLNKRPILDNKYEETLNAFIVTSPHLNT